MGRPIACGIDIVEIAGFGRALLATHDEMVDVCFTKRELRCTRQDWRSLAELWAMKEAVAKALGRGFLKGVGFHDIETIWVGGHHEVRLRADARRLALLLGVTDWRVSVTATSAFAIAVVVAVQRP